MDKQQPSKAARAAALPIFEQVMEMQADGESDHATKVYVAEQLDAYAAERERAARREALEQACKAMCWHCKQGIKAETRHGVNMHWVRDGLHAKSTEGRWVACATSAIRALISETKG